MIFAIYMEWLSLGFSTVLLFCQIISDHLSLYYMHHPAFIFKYVYFCTKYAEQYMYFQVYKVPGEIDDGRTMFGQFS